MVSKLIGSLLFSLMIFGRLASASGNASHLEQIAQASQRGRVRQFSEAYRALKCLDEATPSKKIPRQTLADPKLESSLKAMFKDQKELIRAEVMRGASAEEERMVRANLDALFDDIEGEQKFFTLELAKLPSGGEEVRLVPTAKAREMLLVQSALFHTHIALKGTTFKPLAVKEKGPAPDAGPSGETPANPPIAEQRPKTPPPAHAVPDRVPAEAPGPLDVKPPLISLPPLDPSPPVAAREKCVCTLEERFVGSYGFHTYNGRMPVCVVKRGAKEWWGLSESGNCDRQCRRSNLVSVNGQPALFNMVDDGRCPDGLEYQGVVITGSGVRPEPNLSMPTPP